MRSTYLTPKTMLDSSALRFRPADTHTPPATHAEHPTASTAQVDGLEAALIHHDLSPHPSPTADAPNPKTLPRTRQAPESCVASAQSPSESPAETDRLSCF